MLVRRHWIVLAWPLAVTLFLAGGMAAARAAGRPRLVTVVGVVLLGAAAWTLWRFIDWRCDLWAVTSQRVIDESGVLTVRMVDSPVETILNVTCERTLIGRMLGYGTMNIQTAAEHGSVSIRHVAAPDELRETIMELRERQRGSREARAGEESGAAAVGASVTRECPFCAETIKARARICRFCGRDLVRTEADDVTGRPPGADSLKP